MGDLNIIHWVQEPQQSASSGLAVKALDWLPDLDPSCCLLPTCATGAIPNQQAEIHVCVDAVHLFHVCSRCLNKTQLSGFAAASAPGLCGCFTAALLAETSQATIQRHPCGVLKNNYAELQAVGMLTQLHKFQQRIAGSADTGKISQARMTPHHDALSPLSAKPARWSMTVLLLFNFSTASTFQVSFVWSSL